MAGRIAGITLEIGGDTTKLEKALQGVNRTLKDTQRDLKDVNKLLKIDPGNTELLRQKQELLNKTVEATKEKLEKEKKALEQMKASDTTGEVSREQQALEREIIDTENALKDAQKELKSFGSVGAQQTKVVAEKIKEVGGKVTAVGESLTKNVTVPIAAAGAASVAAWKEVDAGLDIITQKTGASGKALEDMQTSAKNLAKEIPTDFETAGTAIGEVNTRFGLTGKALEDLSGKFIKFAKLNDQDVNSSIDGVQKVMAAFNVDASEAGTVLDLLTKVGQDTGLTMDSLEGSLVKNAVALKEMGFGLSDSATFLGQLEKSGADSSEVLAGLKKALQNAAKEGKPMSTALDEVQKSIQGAKTDTEATQLAMELFGNKAGPAIAKAVREGKLSFEELGTSLTDYSGTVSSTYEETLDPLDKMQTTLNKLKILGTDLVETAAPAIESVMTTLSTTVQDLVDKWESLDQGQQEAILKAALIVAALGPVITVVGGVMNAVAGVIGVVGTLAPIITGTLIPAIGAAAVAAAPFLATGAITAGIIAAAVWITKNWDWIKTKLAELSAKVTEKWNEIKSTISTKVEEIKSNITTKWEAIKTNVTTKVEAIKTTITDKFDAAKTKVETTFSNIKKSITDKIESARDKVEKAVEKIKGFFDFDWSLPDLKIPHFSIQGEFSLNPPSVPYLDVDWYKKAYDNPVMFTRPTVLQTPQGLKGFGDGAGREVVLSEARLRALAGAGASYTVNVYGSPGMDVNALADAVQNRLVALQRQKEAAGFA